MPKVSNHHEVLDGLNYALNREISTAIRYLLQGSSIRGLKNEPLRELYRREFRDELAHAQYLADKIAFLGGKAHVDLDFAPPPEEIGAMLQRDIAEEERDVAHYRKMADLAERTGDIELRTQMETQAAEESRHADELRRLIPQ